MNACVIDLSGVSVEYILTDGSPRTLQEFLIGLAKGKTKRTRSFYALDDISFTVRKGESLGIVGQNGAGKSTLLKVIAGVIKPSCGNVVVKGKIAPLIELGTGFDMELTGRENIYLNASILGLSKRAIDRKFANIVEFSEIANFIHSPLRSYSSGMVARLAFSIAVEVEADILIVDEVLAVGDEGFRKKCHQRIESILNSSTTVLFVSHAMDEVQQFCRSIVWLEHGKIRAAGDTQRISRDYLVHFDKTVFEDVTEEHPYKKYIDAMFIHGITDGYSVNGRRYYSPENRISRAEFAVLLSKAGGIGKSYKAKSIFDDVSESHATARHIMWTYEKGLIDPIKDERGRLYFRPDAYVTAKDVKGILSRMDAHRCEEAMSDGSEFVTLGEIARIFYFFFELTDTA